MTTLLVRLWLPLVGAWALVTVLTAVAFERIASPQAGGRGRYDLDAWLVFAAGGAAAGGLLGTFRVLRDVVEHPALGGALARLFAFAAPGMLLGATLACGVAALVVRAERG